jgi:hypothetical protein
MNKPVDLHELKMSESRDRPRGISWTLWRRHWHALISAERVLRLRDHYALAQDELKARL